MTIPLETVEKIAKLARLKLPKEVAHQKKLQKELSDILSWVQELSTIDVTGVEPLINPSQLFKKSTPTREDKVTDGGFVRDVVSNAPEEAHDMFVVPKVVE